MDTTRTPRELGLTFPPEWAPHAATWLSWPRPEGISFPGRYDHVVPNLAAMIAEICRREPVNVLVPDGAWEERVSEQLRREFQTQKYAAELMDLVRFHHIPTNECWCRDHGPAFLLPAGGRGASAAQPGATEPGMAVVDWGFNAWGGKYPPWDDDDQVPTRIARMLKAPVFEPRHPGGSVVMEGGAVDFNGAGTVLTTTDCLLNPNRNPGLGREQIEQFLLDYYGQRQICWLTGAIAGDDTDGHVDTLARFVNERTIVVGVEADPADENHEVTKAAAEQCRSLRDPDGRPFEVVELPMPGVVEIEETRMPATYMNFYFVNGGLLVPVFGHENDGKALEALARLLPGREVTGVDCRELIWGLGAIHCLTQQQPAST